MYDAEGVRIGKTSGGTEYTYDYLGGKLVKMTKGSISYEFSYDEVGRPYSIRTGNATYYYVLNQQGDVAAIISSAGQVMAEYSYNAWGKVLSATGTLAEDNPLRYRGYVYDTDLCMYYLNSRYYDPEICRFINTDSKLSTGQSVLGCNAFAYCLNDPVRY